MNKILPIINTSGSDSAMLDNALEFMVMNGMDLPLAVMITIPEPWENNKNISPKKRDFYQYYATMLEPWDGPAAILFSDGDVMGAVLDRNGLRPSRYYITKDGRMILSSEVGVLECAPENILVKDRLRPGKMLLVDTVKGEVVDDEKLKEFYASREPYGEWIDRNLVELAKLRIPNVKVEGYTGDQLTRLQKVFGYKYEDVNTLILPMARTGAEPPVPWAPIPRWPCSAASIRRCSATSSSGSRRSPTRPSTPSAKRWSPPPACTSAPTATCWRTSPRTARCSRCTTPS